MFSAEVMYMGNDVRLDVPNQPGLCHSSFSGGGDRWRKRFVKDGEFPLSIVFVLHTIRSLSCLRILSSSFSFPYVLNCFVGYCTSIFVFCHVLLNNQKWLR